ncbi:MAG: RdgB/HAM1 family non-canonical purine NTP pyrophosphatase [Acidobacteria bacterium]|nr:RdgB/HAM1 family non-canonical purine NTP pyrophosphatase [Acidobacteriota bacterium]
MTPAPTLVVATRNAGKLREFQALLRPLGCDVRSLADLGITEEVEENGASFAENARLKAVGHSRLVPFPVLADDSGLMVDALGGRPGIHSARYAGPGATDADRIRRILRELAAVPGAPRTARFVSALALARAGRTLLEAEGSCRGVIIDRARGTRGFGYDPVFLFPELGRTFAELNEEEKNRYSHRARAVRALLATDSLSALIGQPAN